MVYAHAYLVHVHEATPSMVHWYIMDLQNEHCFTTAQQHAFQRTFQAAPPGKTAFALRGKSKHVFFFYNYNLITNILHLTWEDLVTILSVPWI